MLRYASIVLVASLAACIGPSVDDATAADKRPNVIIIYCDDLGWGDLGCYGNEQFKTPTIDRMAEQGARLTNFTSCCPYCAPSRVGLQTGRYQFRSGLINNPAPDAGPEANEYGIPNSEITLGELFRSAGYCTACVGKWHLGHQKQFFPIKHGYQEYLGILYSNDMRPVHLYDGDRLTRTLVVQTSLTKMYTERALKIIDENKSKPFFLYLAHAMPHKPLAASERFYRASGAGLYGDVMAELDWSVSQILDKLKDLELDEQTLIIFSSDNGPWFGGSTGGLRGMKGQTWEGGLRVPLIARWPGHIPEGHVSDEPAVILDVFTTVLNAAGIPIPTDRPIDGKDIMPLLTSDAKSPHESVYSMKGETLCTVRSGKWKLHGPASGPRDLVAAQKSLPTRDPRAPDGFTILAPREQYPTDKLPGVLTGDSDGDWLLFDMEKDPKEQHNVAGDHIDVVRKLRASFDEMLAAMPTKSHEASLPVKKKAEAPKKGDDKPGDKPDDQKPDGKKPAGKKPTEKKPTENKDGNSDGKSDEKNAKEQAAS